VHASPIIDATGPGSGSAPGQTPSVQPTPEPGAQGMLRRCQWRAILGACLLIGWNSVPLAPPPPPADSTQPAFTADTAEVRRLHRDGIITKLRERNSRLSEARAARIADAVLRCTDTQHIPDLTPRLMLSVMFQESGARPHAISPKGAVGLMQVMPYMYRVLDLPGGIAHLESNIEAGCLVLADNIRRLGREKGISSYFWGSHIRSDTYLNGVETILKTLSIDASADANTDASDRG